MGLRRSQTAKRADPGSNHPEAAKVLSIVDAAEHSELFRPWFRDRQSWSSWFTFLRVMFGLPLADEAELQLFRSCTNRSAPAPSGYLEASLIIGRRGGKSLILALIAVYLACFYDWKRYLVSGERGTITVIAVDRKQATVIFKYIRAFLAIGPLAGLIERQTAVEIDLSNSISVEILTASFRGIRGRTCVACLCDELAFWNDEGANPDTEIISALRPTMATIPRAMMLRASSPYARRGQLWNDFKRHFGRDDSATLVWQADTKTMNPSVPQAIIDAAYEDDPADAAAEYGAQFRSDIESFVDRAAVEGVVVTNRYELPPASGVSYSAFCDPSGGGGSDSMTLAISHKEGNVAILDCVREFKPPFSPEAVVSEFATLLKSYHVGTVFGDRFAGMWPAERFQKHGIEYNAAVKPKSDLYRDLLPIVNGARCELLDNARLISQLCALERKTARGGRDSIDHPPNQHDDVVNCVAGSLTNLITIAAPTPLFGTWGRGYGSSPSSAGAIFASAPAEHWARMGIFHPSDEKFWRDKGVWTPPEKSS